MRVRCPTPPIPLPQIGRIAPTDLADDVSGLSASTGRYRSLDEALRRVASEGQMLVELDITYHDRL